VAVGNERAHAELAGEGQGLAVGAFGVLAAARGRDVTGEAEGVGLACPSPEPAGERQCLSGVADGLVDPPGREMVTKAGLVPWFRRRKLIFTASPNSNSWKASKISLRTPDKGRPKHDGRPF
jgi:hypothetical protein